MNLLASVLLVLAAAQNPRPNAPINYTLPGQGNAGLPSAPAGIPANAETMAFADSAVIVRPSPAARHFLLATTPPIPADVTRFVLAQPLDFTPGTRLGYSNFGYMLLGQVIEKASAKPYISFVSETVMAPLGVSADDFQVMSSLMKDRNPREPNYITSLMAPSVFSPGSRVSALDGAVRSETWVAAGSWITTSRAMATFAGRYRLPDGEPLRGKTHDGAHDGEDPGASSIVRQLPNGVSYAVIMNRRNPLHDAIDQCVIDQCPNPPKAPDNEVPWQAQFQHGIDKAVSDAGF